MRYALAVLAVAAAALVWWAARDSLTSRAPAAAPPSEPAAAPVEIVERFEIKVERGVTFVGRVVGAAPGFRPLVTVDVEGQERRQTRADDTGSFALRTGPRPERGAAAAVRVEASMDDLGAVAHLWLEPTGPDRVRVPTLFLRPLHPLRITVTGRGQPLPGALVAVADVGTVITDASGVASVRLRAGEHEVRAACEGYGRAVTKATVPGQSEVALDLPRERAVAVTVVDKSTGRGIAGATLDVHEERPGSRLESFAPPLAVAATDGRGVTVLRGLSDDTVVRVAARAPGYPPPDLFFGIGKTVIPAQVTEFRIELDPPRTIRWRVVAGELAVPPPGTPIAIRPWPGSYLREVPPEGAMEGQDLVVAGWGPGPAHGIAEEPGGGLAFLQAQAGRDGGEVSFRKPRQVIVLACEPSGAPVSGAGFVLRDPGGNAMAPAGTTGDDGRLTFEGLVGGRADVYYLPNPADVHSGSLSAGTVDLDPGDRFVEFVLQPAVDLVVRVRVDGKPGIPEGYTLYADDAPVDADEDYGAGILRARVRPAREGVVRVALGAPGYPAVRTETRTGEVDIDLRSGGRLYLDVIQPPEGRGSVRIEEWSADWNVWIDLRARANRQGEKGFLRVAAGRYRARDRRSGLESEEVEIEDGGEAHLFLDLTRTAVVRGRVEMPEGTDVSAVRVRVEGIEVQGVRGNLLGLAPDGTFRLAAPPDATIKLRASHPLLRAANDVTVTGSRDDVVLRLATGPTATVEVDRALADPGDSRAEVGIVLYRGDAEGTPIAWLRAAVDGRVLRFGGFEPGTYNVWIDARPFAPLVLRGIALHEGTNDLGRAVTTDGASIRVKILVPEGQAAPRIGFFATRDGEPSYARGLNSSGESEVVLRGLGAGTFWISGGPLVAGGLGKLDGKVTLDGVEEHEIVLDLR